MWTLLFSLTVFAHGQLNDERVWDKVAAHFAWPPASRGFASFRDFFHDDRKASAIWVGTDEFDQFMKFLPTYFDARELNIIQVSAEAALDAESVLRQLRDWTVNLVVIPVELPELSLAERGERMVLIEKQLRRRKPITKLMFVPRRPLLLEDGFESRWTLLDLNAFEGTLIRNRSRLNDDQAWEDVVLSIGEAYRPVVNQLREAYLTKWPPAIVVGVASDQLAINLVDELGRTFPSENVDAVRARYLAVGRRLPPESSTMFDDLVDWAERPAGNEAHRKLVIATARPMLVHTKFTRRALELRAPGDCARYLSMVL